jgi:polysaccharide biosynthesis protein PslG
MLAIVLPARVRVLAPAVAVLAFLALPGLAAAKVRPALHGVQIGSIRAGLPEAALRDDLAQAKLLGANIVRTDIDWAQLEPSQGTYDQAYVERVDRFMADARARGIKILLTVGTTPCWNSVAPTGTDCTTATLWQPRDLDAYAKAAAFTAGRWGADIAGLELWNEPDQRNELYWRGPDKVARYAELVKTAYPAIKAASPTTKVLAGSMVGGNGKFLEALYKAGIKGSYDGLSVHYYDLVLYSLGQIRKMRAKYKDRTPLWLAEFGWTSCLSKTRTFQDGHFCVTRTQQARNTVDVLRVLGRQNDVQAAVLFGLRDNPQYDFGVLDAGGARKPLFAAVRDAFRGKLGKARTVKVRLRRAGGRIVAAGSAPAGDVLELDAYQGRTLRYRAAFRPGRDGRYSLRLPKALGTRGIAVRVAQVSVRGSRPAIARS